MNSTASPSMRLSHTWFWKPFGPPCRWLGPLLIGRVYSTPSTTILPLAMRFAKRPGTLPEQGPSAK